MMNDYQEHLRDLSEIRSIMERSTKFISLSGLSGISAGLIALGGAYVGYRYLQAEGLYQDLISLEYRLVSWEQLFSLVGLSLLIIALAAGAASFFSIRLARKHKLPVWNATAKHMLWSLMIPLISGGLFCVLLAWKGFGVMVAPATLIFYGLALVSAGRYTLKEIRMLGMSEIFLGLLGAYFLGYGLIIWALGFGLLHILYGIVMYLKYER